MNDGKWLPRWPQEDPLTQRKMCQSCWNHYHCMNKNQRCNCLCLDKRPDRATQTDKGERSLDIAETYGTIEAGHCAQAKLEP